MANLKLKIKDGKFDTNGDWVNAWDPSIDLGYPSDKLKDLPSDVKKIKITHPDNNITYVPFASDGNEYWEKKTHGTILVQNGWILENIVPKFELKQVQTCHLTIDGKYPLKFRNYIKFRIRYNLGPNINGVSTNVNSVWNNNTAFAYTSNMSSSISNPENYYILIIGRAIYKLNRSVGDEQFVLVQSPLSVNKVNDNSGRYFTPYSIIGEGEHGTQWCDAGEAADWAGETAKIYWLLVNNVRRVDKNNSWGMRTPYCPVGGREESSEDYITSETTGTPEHNGLVSRAERSAGMTLQWQSGYYYTQFYFNENGDFTVDDYYYTNYKSDLSGTPSFDWTMYTNATFDIVRSGEVTLSCHGKRKKIGKTWQQIGEDGYGNPIHGYMYHVSEGDNQTDAYSDYIYIYL